MSLATRLRAAERHPWAIIPLLAEPTPEPVLPPSTWPLEEHQKPPIPEGSWDTWVLLGGRGVGKTFTGARYVLQHLRDEGRRARVAVAAPTLADVRDVCAEGETGLMTIAPDEFPTYHRSVGYAEARHIGGGYIRFLGTEQPNRWNGPQWSLGWWDEWPLCNLESYKQYQFGLRLGAWPRTVITCTPKAVAKAELEALLKRPGVVSYQGIRTWDAVHLAQRRRDELVRDFGGTTLALAELEGQLVFDTEGALWKYEWIEAHRLGHPPALLRVVVALDPAGGHGNGSAETGFAVAGMDAGGQYYVLAAEGAQYDPDDWLNHAIGLYELHAADSLIVEQNYGGRFIRQMVENLPRETRDRLAVRFVSATRGKAVRAEPIAALYQQGRVHHVGRFEEAEGQLTSFPLAKRKDMVDALVWALTELSTTPVAGSWSDLDRRRSRPGMFAGRR